MARVKEFDEAKVLDRAVEIFRARGFQSTSFADLTDELGVCRQSLYDTYGDKDALFKAALKRYRKRALDSMAQMLAEPGPIRPTLERLFSSMVLNACSEGSPGCLLVNSMVERAPRDEEVRALSVAHAREVERRIASRLRSAQRAGEISKDKDPLALARYFGHLILGLAVAARALGEREALLASARLALKALD